MESPIWFHEWTALPASLKMLEVYAIVASKEGASGVECIRRSDSWEVHILKEGRRDFEYGPPETKKFDCVTQDLTRLAAGLATGDIHNWYLSTPTTPLVVSVRLSLANLPVISMEAIEKPSSTAASEMLVEFMKSEHFHCCESS